ncbi:DUF1223 domain-containing protein [Mucilaginibacter terrigena]|uniref:DUF1223 domain-containing protein n=1 Tax=Mucilaginibacter terrigena TaxID=2492395 RepID=A0A4V1ZBM5_9SPHI|nr:DUF1223 domain-containing protein [Mucilaginibacter terrigena]RYU89447.1 DUF1223 domain-containing protein [Mucilaginibacter terrigena]
MKNIKILFVVFAVAVMALASAAFINKSTVKPVIVTNGDGFAVVELFTSEGCSSCPPADGLIAKIQKESAGKPVYILAYHVDYWNRLGWKDVFSKAEFSHRQSAYSVWLKLKGVYTPQAIVNGKTEFVGSEQGSLYNAIRTGLGKGTVTPVSLTNVNVSGHNAVLKYNAANAADNTTLQLALVQKNAVSHIKSGENNGRTLSHIQIVNELKGIPLGEHKQGETNIKLPGNFTAAGFELIAFVQNNATGEITGATRAAFTATVTASN